MSACRAQEMHDYTTMMQVHISSTRARSYIIRDEGSPSRSLYPIPDPQAQPKSKSKASEMSSPSSISIPFPVFIPTASDEEKVCEKIVIAIDEDFDYNFWLKRDHVVGCPSNDLLRPLPRSLLHRLLYAISSRILPSIQDILENALHPVWWSTTTITSGGDPNDTVVAALAQLAECKNNAEVVLSLLDLLTFNDREPVRKKAEEALFQLGDMDKNGVVPTTSQDSPNLVRSSEFTARRIHDLAARDCRQEFAKIQSVEDSWNHRHPAKFRDTYRKQPEEKKEMVKRCVVKKMVGTYLTYLRNAIMCSRIQGPPDGHVVSWKASYDAGGGEQEPSARCDVCTGRCLLQRREASPRLGLHGGGAARRCDACRLHGLFPNNSSQADRAIVLAAVRQNGCALQFASDGLRADREVVLAAVTQKGSALQLALDSYRADRGFVLEAVGKNGRALRHVSGCLRDDREVVLAAVRQNGVALACASDGLRADRAFVLEALRTNGMALQYVKGATKDREFVLAAVRQNGLALWYVAGTALQEDKEVVLAAVSQNGSALQFVPAFLRGEWGAVLADKGIVLAAVSQNPGEALQYASEELQADEEVKEAAQLS